MTTKTNSSNVACNNIDLDKLEAELNAVPDARSALVGREVLESLIAQARADRAAQGDTVTSQEGTTRQATHSSSVAARIGLIPEGTSEAEYWRQEAAKSAARVLVLKRQLDQVITHAATDQPSAGQVESNKEIAERWERMMLDQRLNMSGSKEPPKGWAGPSAAAISYKTSRLSGFGPWEPTTLGHGCVIVLRGDEDKQVKFLYDRASLTPTAPRDGDLSPIERLSQATTRPYEPVYQVWHVAGDGGWLDTVKDHYDRTPENSRRITYTPTAPQAASPAQNEGVWSWDRRAEAAEAFMRNYADTHMEELLGGYHVQPIIRRLAAAIKEWQEDVIREAPNGVVGIDIPVAAPQAASQQRSICHKDAGVCGVGGYCQDCHLGAPQAATVASPEDTTTASAAASQAATDEPLCTLRSAFDAIDFMEQHNGPSRAHWALGKLKRVDAAPVQAAQPALPADSAAWEWASSVKLADDEVMFFSQIYQTTDGFPVMTDIYRAMIAAAPKPQEGNT